MVWLCMLPAESGETDQFDRGVCVYGERGYAVCTSVYGKYIEENGWRARGTGACGFADAVGRGGCGHGRGEGNGVCTCDADSGMV